MNSMETQENITSIMSLPQEILHFIFKNLSVIELSRCRQVSVLWKQIADSEDIWREHCMREHREAIEEAILKCNPNLSWRNLFKSISMSSKLTSANLTWTTFIHADIDYEIRGINVRYGIVAIHKSSSIDYYDIDSPKRIYSFKGDYAKYEENNDLLVLMGYLPENEVKRDACLRIIRKVDDRPILDSVVVIENVANFKIVDKDVYYLIQKNKEHSEIYVCKYSDDYRSSFMYRIQKHVYAFSDKGNSFKVLTTPCNLYEYVGTEFILRKSYNMHPNTDYRYLMKFNFFEDLNFFKHYIGCCLAFSKYPPTSDTYTFFYNASTITFIYGNMLLIGDSFGAIRIYLVNSISFDVNNPDKEFHISDCKGQSAELSINGLEVVDTDRGRVVVISTPKSVVTVNLD